LELFPAFKIGLLNGWLLIAIFFLVFGIIIKICPREVVKRLYDEQGWTKKQYMFTRLAKICGVIHIILLIFTPLKIGSIEFIIGTIIFVIATIGMAIALINFKNAQLNKPINRGLYKISRNPQILMLYLVSYGTSLAIGSWTAVIVVTLSMLFSHFRILGEEKRLEAQYGDSYLEYKKSIPRYFLFF
jgi:protein-S-isoprenylcysteine O-methyltransferase Ste14